MNIQDTLLVTMSDMHSGSNKALFVNHQWLDDEHQQPMPNARQKRIYEVFERTIEAARAARKNKRLILVHDGDAIEGRHHNTLELSLFSTKSQAKVHVELMDTFMRGVGFNHKKGDRLFYIRGTETHVEDIENDIGKDLGAEQKTDGLHVFDHLDLMVNGKKIWFAHHGPRRGNGANEGDALRNWLRNIYWDLKKREIAPPDMVITGHNHTATYNVYMARERRGFRPVHGIICPSWQSKTRFAYKKAAVEVNEIGAVMVEIKAGGEIRFPEFILEETETTNLVTV
jgi:hypothetical protein